MVAPGQTPSAEAGCSTRGPGAGGVVGGFAPLVGFVGVDEDYLAWLYVDPAHYGKGIGRELLRIGIREIGEGAWTIVLDGNKNAIKLYESEGFQDTGRFNGDNNGYPVTYIKMKRTEKGNVSP